ncbi:MAG: insulinase family protein, partial [Sphingobacteriia bacterium]
EHYLNKPYGDVWHKMRTLAYTQHPYRWMTIGAELSHVENATIEDVKSFFYKHYRPVNAILTVAGNVKTDEVKRLAEKWFGPIPMGTPYQRELPQEPVQTQARRLTVKANVPVDAFVKTWHMCARNHADYHAADLITEVLGGGGSSRLYQSLVKEQKLFANLDCYHFGSLDAGLMTIEGKLVHGVSAEKAEAAVNAELEAFLAQPISDKELQKVINKTESAIAFEDMSIMSRASSLAFYQLLGDAGEMNTELDKYRQVTPTSLQNLARNIFQETNSNTLYYLSQQNTL